MASKTTLSKSVVIYSLYFLLAISGLFFTINAQSFGVPALTTVGVGSRATAMANNFVALSDDASAMFWNPAGMAFNPSKEIQISFNGLSQVLDAEFKHNLGSKETHSDRQRFYISNAAYLRSIPTTSGGFSFALGFQSPFLLDDIVNFEGEYLEEPDNYSNSTNYYSFGQMNLWTGAFGIQVAPNLGLGAAISLLTGKNTMKEKAIEYKNDTLIESLYFLNEINQSYIGYDLRLGMLYKFLNRAAVGIRIVIPRYIFFEEDFADELYPENSDTFTGRLTSSYSGAVGFSYTLPFMTISIESNADAPHPNAEENSIFTYWKVGGGIGIEIPLFIKSLLLRAGYAIYDYNRTPLLIDYKDLTEESFDEGLDLGRTTVNYENFLSAGISYMTNNSISFDVTYNYRFWKVSTEDILFEKHGLHRILTSLAFRF